jgi:hypothetical protein
MEINMPEIRPGTKFEAWISQGNRLRQKAIEAVAQAAPFTGTVHEKRFEVEQAWEDWEVMMPSDEIEQLNYIAHSFERFAEVTRSLDGKNFSSVFERQKLRFARLLPYFREDLSSYYKEMFQVPRLDDVVGLLSAYGNYVEALPPLLKIVQSVTGGYDEAKGSMLAMRMHSAQVLFDLAEQCNETVVEQFMIPAMKAIQAVETGKQKDEILKYGASTITNYVKFIEPDNAVSLIDAAKGMVYLDQLASKVGIKLTKAPA